MPKTIPLWDSPAPAALGGEAADVPTLTLFPRQAAKGAFVVCPGGGYGWLAPHESEPIAEWINALGIAAVVLRYRLGPKYRHPVMHQDVTRAVRLTRHLLPELGVAGGKVGVLGFSAGGHLAATASTQWSAANKEAGDPIDRQSSRPDASVLVYPVITMRDPFTHQGSRTNLLGSSPSADLIDAMSAERRVTDQTPPTFIFHTVDDGAVPVENALMYADALRRHRVIFEMHLYQKGVHGVGLANDDPVLRTWPDRCADWLRGQGF